MHILMKNIWTALALMATTVGMAQNGRFSAGPEMAIPLGDYGKVAGIGIGLGLGYERPANDNFSIGYQLGYINIGGKDIELTSPTGEVFNVRRSSQGAIPVQTALKYYITGQQKGAYAGLLAGVQLTLAKVVVLDVATATVTEEPDTQVNFSLAPMVGFMVTENVDVALRYQVFFGSVDEMDLVTREISTRTVSYAYLGLRVAYMFGRG